MFCDVVEQDNDAIANFLLQPSVIAVLLTANYVRSTAVAVGESKILGRNHL